ncbi:MAG: zinc chelation protein SecC [Gammaproteobacteria bacterium]|nr:zinc chelation protein SecC [Gammaproteobacteria bacterium]
MTKTLTQSDHTAHVHGPDCDHDHSHQEHIHHPGCSHYPNEPYVRQGEKVGRNDPCPCGSGFKYKKCCA